MRVLVGDQLVALGTITGPGVGLATPTPTVLPAGQSRVERTWGATPHDLDGDLWVPLAPPVPHPPPSR